MTTQFVAIVLGVALALIVYILTVFRVYRSLYVKVGPNEALVIAGRKGDWIEDESGERRRIGYRIVSGGGTLVNPILERVEKLSLALMALEIDAPGIAARSGGIVRIEGTARIKIRADDAALRRAAELFLSKPSEEISREAREVILAHLAAVVGAMDVEEIGASPESLAERVADAAARDLGNMGLEIVAFAVRPVAAVHVRLQPADADQPVSTLPAG